MDFLTRNLLRRYRETGDFIHFLSFVAQLERAGDVPTGSTEIVLARDWSTLYNTRSELVGWPGALYLLEFLFGLPDEVEIVTDNGLPVGMGIARNNLIYTIVEAGGEELLLRSILAMQEEDDLRVTIAKLETTHALHAAPRLPGTSPRVIQALRQLIQLATKKKTPVLSHHVQSAATNLAIMGTPQDIDVMVDFIMSFDEYPGWTPISVLESIGVLGGIDALMLILENNPIRGIVEYGSRVLAQTVIWFNPARIPETIEFLEELVVYLDQHPTGTYHDRSGVIQAINLLRHNHRPDLDVYGYQGGWGSFLDLFRRRQAYWQSRRAQRRLRERTS